MVDQVLVNGFDLIGSAYIAGDVEQEPKSAWDLARDYVDIELETIKFMDITKIPKALVDLFSEYACKDKLGSDFCGNDGATGIDREFAQAAMGERFTEIGAGSFSVAYRLNEDWIIKLNIADTIYEWGDDGGFDWAKACTEIQGNVFAPKIAALYQNGRIYAMVVESLGENDNLEAPDGGCFRDLAESHHPELNFGEYISELMEHETFVLMAAINRNDLIQVSKMFDVIATKTKTGTDDLSDFNMMVRGKIPVVNDPFGASKSCELVEGNSFSWTM